MTEGERKEAIHEAATALGVTAEYDVRVLVTKREEIINNTYEAVDLADLERLIRLDLEVESEIEGDEIAYAAKLTDDGGYPRDEADESEIDLRIAGEPFSWAACDFVKELAKDDGFKSERDAVVALATWVGKAKALLKQPTGD